MGHRTREDDLTPAQRTERDARLAAAPRMSDAELAAFRARVQAWDAANPDIAAQLTPEQRGY
jgi:hypothetical protein